MADVFISYAHADSEIAKLLAGELTAHGISVFFDKDVLVAGTDFRQDIAQALSGAKAIIVLLSSNTKRSSWVQEELSSVIEKTDGPRVIPVLLDRHAKENWVWPLVSDRQAVDLSTRQEKIGEVALQVSRLLSEGGIRPASPRSSPTVSRSSKRVALFVVATAVVAASLSLSPLLQAPADLPSPEGPGIQSFNLLLWVAPVSAAVGFVVGYWFSKWRK